MAITRLTNRILENNIQIATIAYTVQSSCGHRVFEKSVSHSSGLLVQSVWLLPNDSINTTLGQSTFNHKIYRCHCNNTCFATLQNLSGLCLFPLLRSSVSNERHSYNCFVFFPLLLFFFSDTIYQKRFSRFQRNLKISHQTKFVRKILINFLVVTSDLEIYQI